MSVHDKKWDKLLKIKTTGRDDSKADLYRYSYEPTPYTVLERLVNGGLIGKNDVILDYGCGKGRVGFFLSYHTKAKSIGIEYNEKVYEIAKKNQKKATLAEQICFIKQNAENYKVPVEVNRCYFFNPFSVEILERVIEKIIESYYLKPREIMLFFYYPSREYISYLMTINELECIGEIDCGDLFNGDNWRERIAIYKT